jgi:S-adenosylmethionine:tRNA ribosyltransferase-isomerase
MEFPKMSFQIKDYDYHLPKDLIAQIPAIERDQSRLLVYDRKTKKIKHSQFSHLTDYLSSNDLLVVNNTRVIPARLLGKKETGGKIEVFVLDYHQAVMEKQNNSVQCLCMIRSSKPPKPGSTIYFSPTDRGVILSLPVNGKCNIQFTCENFLDFLNKMGQVPLPPYIQRSAENIDKKRYQTIYSANDGAVAAPTAGLHFTDVLFEKIQSIKAQIVPITLHVGYGTFMPVRVSDIRQHAMHAEYVEISSQSAKIIQGAMNNKKRIIAVGTTCVRTLEYVYQLKKEITPYKGYCDIFIYPPFSFQVVGAMITNFHLPQSTLLMMIASFVGRKEILSVYQEAISEKYRFFSYGDAMAII